MELTLNWKGKLEFDGATESGFVQKLDAEEAAGGTNKGARPMEFIALGLAGCTAMDVVSILQKKKQQIADFQIKFRGARAAEHPKVFTSAIIEYLIYGSNVDESAVLRAIELSAEKYCPAQAMLDKVFPIELRYRIFDAGSKELVKEGGYKKAGA